MAKKKADLVMEVKHLLKDLEDELVAYSKLPTKDINEFFGKIMKARETLQDKYQKVHGARAESRLRPIAFYRKGEDHVTRIDAYSILREGDEYKLFNHLKDEVVEANLSGSFRIKDSTGAFVTLTKNTLKEIYHYNYVFGDKKRPFYEFKR